MCPPSPSAILSPSQRRDDHASERRARMALAPLLTPGLRGGPASGATPSSPPRPLVCGVHRGPSLRSPGSPTPLSPLWALAGRAGPHRRHRARPPALLATAHSSPEMVLKGRLRGRSVDLKHKDTKGTEGSSQWIDPNQFGKIMPLITDKTTKRMLILPN
jgi:hypothetical protein